MIAIIADQRVYQDTHIPGFNQYTGVTEITHPDLITSIFTIRGRHRFSEESFKKSVMFRSDAQQFLNITQWSGRSLHIRQYIYTRMVKRNVQVQYILLIQPGRTQAKRPVVILSQP
jgi:hypothetical protein